MPWLRAQLDEDERIARACPGSGEWKARDIAFYGADLSPEVRAHMAEHGPARVPRGMAPVNRNNGHTVTKGEENMQRIEKVEIHSGNGDIRELTHKDLVKWLELAVGPLARKSDRMPTVVAWEIAEHLFGRSPVAKEVGERAEENVLDALSGENVPLEEIHHVVLYEYGLLGVRLVPENAALIAERLLEKNRKGAK